MKTEILKLRGLLIVALIVGVSIPLSIWLTYIDANRQIRKAEIAYDEAIMQFGKVMLRYSQLSYSFAYLRVTNRTNSLSFDDRFQEITMKIIIAIEAIATAQSILSLEIYVITDDLLTLKHFSAVYLIREKVTQLIWYTDEALRYLDAAWEALKQLTKDIIK